MQVHIQNDGPVTLQFETPNLPKPKEVRVNLGSYPVYILAYTVIPYSQRKPPGGSKKEGAGKSTGGATGSDSATAAVAELSLQDS